MNLTKDQLTLIRYGLDIVCRTEAQGLGQAGLNGLKEGRVNTLVDRLKMAVELEGQITAEFARLDELEKSASAPDANAKE